MRDPNVEDSLIDRVIPRLPFFDRDAPLSIIPRDWLMHVEPKIVRYKDSFKHGDCWFWIGARDHAGEPKKTRHMHGKGTQRMHQYVMEIFYVIKVDRCRGLNFVHRCQNLTCLNPSHIMICETTYRDRNKEEIYSKCLTASAVGISKDTLGQAREEGLI